MSRRGPNVQQGSKGQCNPFNRTGKRNNYQGGQQQKQQRQSVSVFLSPPAPTLSLSEPVNTSLFASYSGKPLINNNNNHHNRGGPGVSQYKYQSFPQHRNGQDSYTDLNINEMESNPTRSSTPNRGRGGARGRGGGISGRRCRGNGESRGGRGVAYQVRDGVRNDSWNSPVAILSSDNDEYEDSVLDLTTPHMAKFSNNSLEQASYEELKIARDRERRDAIANGTIDDPEQRKTLEHAIDFVGTCVDMCPLFERQQRAVQNAVDRWEINPATGKIDKALAVKQFHRPAAGNDAQLPSDVRPPRILVSTLDYLINEIAGGDEPLELTHPFLRDRTRGIRQDFTLQNYRGSETVSCHELIARFHILSMHKLCDETKNFVPQQEMEQLQKVLTTLSELYEDARLVNIIYPNEPEFRAYQIIAHLRDPDQERQAQRWPDHVFNSKSVQQALRFLILTQRNNDEVVHMRVGNAESCSNFFGTVFRLVKAKSTSYLMACLLETHFNEIRKTALKAIKNTYRPDTKQLLLKDVVEMLAYEDEETAFRDCEYYGIGLGQVEVEGQMVWHLVIRKGGANWNEGLSSLRQSFHTKLVESKIGNRSIPDVIHGRQASGNKSFNPAVAPFVPRHTAFGKTSSASSSLAPLQTNIFSKAIAAPHSTANALAIVSTAQQVGFTPTMPKPVAGTFANTASHRLPNDFQKTSSTSVQAANVFQKASNTQSMFKPQITTGTPFWGISQDPHLAQVSTQPLVSVFTPGARTSSEFSTTLPGAVFAPKTTMLTAGNVFNPPQTTTPVNNLPSGIFTASATLAPAQSPNFELGSAGISQLSTSQPFFHQARSKVAPGVGFQPSQAPSTGLFQPQASSTSFRSTSSQPGSPKVTPGGIFRPSTTSSSPPPPSTTPFASLFQPPNTAKSSLVASATTGPSSGGSLFDAHSGRQSFPSNLFSTPTTLANDDENDEGLYSNPVPAQKLSCGSQFDRVSNIPAQDTLTQPTADAPKALLPFTPSISLMHPSTVTLSSSFTTPGLFSQPVPATSVQLSKQLAPAAKSLVPRSAAWELANSLFNEIITKEVTKTVQSAVDEDKGNVINTVAAEKYDDTKKLVAREIALDIVADQFYANRSGARIFYAWKAKARKMAMKRTAEERRRNPPAPPPVQWRPVQIPEEAFDGPINEVQRMTTRIYQSVPLKEIFLPKVEQAFWPTGEGDRRWRLLCRSANTAADVGNYWWIEKFIGNGEPCIAESKKGTFEVQFDLTDAYAEAREVGGFVFGCSADYTISNKERFKEDKANLHEAVNWLAGVTELAKLAIMVVCYRSPLDTEDADPYGRDMGRTSGPGRRARIAAIRKALDLDAFSEKVISRDIILVENLGDCNFIPTVKQFSNLVLETVNPKVAGMMSRIPSRTTGKQNSAKRKRAARLQELSVESPKPTKPALQAALTPESRPKRQRAIQNVGMQTKYFTIKSRGLHVDWNKFQIPGGGNLGDGVENPVAEEYLVTTTPITTPEMRPVSPKKDSPFNELKDDLLDLERIMVQVNGMFDDSIEELEVMKIRIGGIDGEFNYPMEC